MIRENIPKASGIYQIRNLVNGKVYVGSARNLRARAYSHAKQLRDGTHHNQHLQRANDKYGHGSFEFRPILLCAEEHLLFYEQRAIDSPREKYNMQPTAGSALGIKRSEETKKRMSVAVKDAARKRAKLYRYCGEDLMMSDMVELSGHSEAVLRHRIITLGWGVGEALETPVDGSAHKQAAANRAGTSTVSFKGKDVTVKQLSELAGVPWGTVNARLRAGWDVEKAAYTPPRRITTESEKWQARRATVVYEGGEITYTGLSELCGIGVSTLRDRIIKRGMTPECAASTPLRGSK